MIRLKDMGWIFFFMLLPTCALAQKEISGVVKDADTDERIPFATIYLNQSTSGIMTDSVGCFRISIATSSDTSLTISSVGYITQTVNISSLPDSITLYLHPSTYDDVIIKTKIDFGKMIWKNIVKHKPQNNRFKRFDNFYYEIYNKLELDIKNLKSIQKITSIKPFKPLNTLINQNIDTAEGEKILPAYFTESLSDYYFQKKPLRRREEIKAANTNGIKNESILKFLGGTDQVINIYNDFINIFNKEFVSPASDNGFFYYKYNVADTQNIDGQKFYHLIFTARRPGMNTFEGDCWVAAGSYAIQKINLRLTKKADINFLNKFNLIQEYTKINDSTWMILKDKMVADFTPVGNKMPGFIARKTATYHNPLMNDERVTRKLNENKLQEEIIVLDTARNKSNDYWAGARHEELSKNEQAIAHMLDTIMNTPTYQRLTKTIFFLGTGYIDVGNVELGSAYNWFSANNWEGFRMRFDVASNKHFNKKFRWHTYLAYGFKDRKLKGEAELFYLPKKDPRQYWYLQYKNDLDFGQTYFGEISADNIFSFAIRKPDIPLKFINLEQKTFEFFNEFNNGFSTLFSINNKTYTPLQNLISGDAFGQGSNSLISTELSLRLRYAFQEKFIENTFFRSSLGSPYPIVEATFSKGIAGLLKSNYNYSKLLVTVSDIIKTPPFGSISYQAYAGKTFGTVPYTFLNIAPGNEMYYYNKYAFNMMNRYEFIHDKMAGINYEHNIGNGIFKLVPGLKFRQFYTIKALWGSLSPENKAFNFKEGHNFQTLDGKTYLELGTGIDNILHFLRVDFIWRVLPKSDLRDTSKKFGIFGSFRLNF